MTPEQILSAYDGWHSYHEITEEHYNQIQSHILKTKQ
jgi:hypothetical protein